MSIFKLPDLGEGLPDAEIREWHVKVGDTVKVDQPLVSMETAKAVLDVPSPWAGKITALHGKPGEVIPVGATLIEFETESQDSGTVAGKIEVGNEVVEEKAFAVQAAGKAASAGIGKATPAIRALAKSLEVDLARVSPTGPNGTITADDVKRTKALFDEMGPLEPLRGARRMMAQTMAQAHAEVVPVTLVDDADIHAWQPNTDITVRLIRAIVAGCRKEPALNAWYDSQAMGQRRLAQVHLGLAVDTEEGLFVPVLRHAEKLCEADAAHVRDHIETIKQNVKNRTIPADDLRGATITLSNFGNMAGRYASPIVVPPQVAILACGRLREIAVGVNGKLEAHRVIPLSLTFDHRAVTGGEAARFLAAVMADLALAL